MFKFDLIKKDTTCRARLGKVTTTHGEFETPVFMPLGAKEERRQLFGDV